MDKYLSEIFTAWCMDTKQPHNKDSVAPLRQAINRDCSDEKIVLPSQRIGPGTTTALCKVLLEVPTIRLLDLHENVLRDRGVSTLVDTFITISENNKRAIAKQEVRNTLERMENLYSQDDILSPTSSGSLTDHKCNITFLNLGSNDIGRKGIEYLSEWLTHESCQLKTLILGSEKNGLYGNKIDSECASLLAVSLRRNQSLTALDLNRCEDIGKKDQKAFIDFANTFDLSGKGISAYIDEQKEQHENQTNMVAMMNSISDLTSYPELNNILLPGSHTTELVNNLAKSALRASGTYNPLPIKILRLGEVHMKTASAISLIRSLEGNTELTYLDLRDNKLHHQVAEALGQLLHQSSKGEGCNIATLLLQGNRFKNKGIQALSPALKHATNLCVLNLSDNKLGNDAMAILGQYIQQSISLTHLDLSDNQISEEGAMALADSISPNPVLSHLIMSGNKIGNRGANAFAKCLIQIDLTMNSTESDSKQVLVRKSQSNLININFNNCGIGDEGAVSLCVSLACNRTLLTLGLRNNYLTENETGKILSEILTAKRNTSILSIDVRGNQIDHPTMLEISKSLRRNKLSRSMVHPNKLRKKVIQLKYTGHLLEEARQSLIKYRETREKAEERVEYTKYETRRMLEEFKDLQTEYIQQQQNEESLMQSIIQRYRAREEEQLVQLRLQEQKLQAATDSMHHEASVKKALEQEIANLEAEIIASKENGDKEAQNIQEQIEVLKKQIKLTEKTASKTRKELSQAKKKVAALEETISPAIVEAINFKLKQESGKNNEVPADIEHNGSSTVGIDTNSSLKREVPGLPIRNNLSQKLTPLHGVNHSRASHEEQNMHEEGDDDEEEEEGEDEESTVSKNSHRDSHRTPNVKVTNIEIK